MSLISAFCFVLLQSLLRNTYILLKNELTPKKLKKYEYNEARQLLCLNLIEVNAVDRCEKDLYYNIALLKLARKAKSQSDEAYMLLGDLLRYRSININARCGFLLRSTVLSELCRDENSLLAVKLLLNDRRTDVNLGFKKPVFHAAKKTNKKGDYFYQVLLLLFNHSRIDLNAKCGFNNSILASLIEMQLKSTIGIELLLSDSRCNIYKGSPAYLSVKYKKWDVFQLFLEHKEFKINKVCTFSNNQLPIEAIDFSKTHRLLSDEGKSLQYLCEKGADLNITDRKNIPPILNFLRFASKEDPHFKSTLETLKFLEYLLRHGSDANLHSATLANAVNFCSYDVCRLLVNFGAYVDSAFDLPHNTFQIPNHKTYRNFKEIFFKSKERALHVACRIGSDRKLRLLLDNETDPTSKWIGELYTDIQNKYAVKHLASRSRIDTKSTPSSSDAIEDVLKCREFMRRRETMSLFRSVQKLMQQIRDRLSRDFKTNLQISLSGSCRENTKCFAPSEFDYIFEVSSSDINEKNLSAFARGCYFCIDALVRAHDTTIRSSDNRLTTQALLHENKIAKLHLLWIGKTFKTLDILVDVVILSDDNVVKYFRQAPFHGPGLRRSYHTLENEMVQNLSPNLFCGYILAKAVRLASISQPPNLHEFDLEEPINIDDVITSYILKACLFGREKEKEEYS